MSARNKQLQSKHFDDVDILLCGARARVSDRYAGAVMSDAPTNLVKAKLRKLYKRGLIFRPVGLFVNLTVAGWKFLLDSMPSMSADQRTDACIALRVVLCTWTLEPERRMLYLVPVHWASNIPQGYLLCSTDGQQAEWDFSNDDVREYLAYGVLGEVAPC